MTEYLKAQTKTNEQIIKSSFSTDELQRFSKADFRWADNKTSHFQSRTVKKGEIYQFEFGKNYTPEMSYEHRGLIIGVKKKLLYVLPIFTYNSQKHIDVYHPIDFPNSTSDLFLLKKEDFSFISHDSVLKTNDMRTVSINRILYKHNGQIPPDSSTYKQIETLALKKYFPAFLYDYEQNKQNLQSLEETISLLETENHTLQQENDFLWQEIANLQNQLVTNM